MLKLIVILSMVSLSLPGFTTEIEDNKPVQHMKVADVETLEDARKNFSEQTAKLRSKNKLDLKELNEIHIITYTLEKSVAYLVENMSGANKELAKKIAVTVENIHLDSENNRQDKTRAHLNEYFKMAEQLL